METKSPLEVQASSTTFDNSSNRQPKVVFALARWNDGDGRKHTRFGTGGARQKHLIEDATTHMLDTIPLILRWLAAVYAWQQLRVCPNFDYREL